MRWRSVVTPQQRIAKPHPQPAGGKPQSSRPPQPAEVELEPGERTPGLYDPLDPESPVTPADLIARAEAKWAYRRILRRLAIAVYFVAAGAAFVVLVVLILRAVAALLPGDWDPPQP